MANDFQSQEPALYGSSDSKIRDITNYIQGVIDMYNEGNTINPDKHLNFDVKRVDDHYYVTFNWIIKEYLTRPGQEGPSPESEWDSYGFEIRDSLIDSVIIALDLATEHKLKVI